MHPQTQHKINKEPKMIPAHIPACGSRFAIESTNKLVPLEDLRLEYVRLLSIFEIVMRKCLKIHR